jgi:Tfp pilus assembly protein PilO
MEDSMKITKLSTENWPQWKFQMKVILNSLEVGSIISGDWTKPSSKTTKTLDKKNDEEAKIRWQK